MLRIRTILFPTDFSESAQQALPYALFLAELFDAELRLLHVEVTSGRDGGDSSPAVAAASSRRDAGARLAAIVAEHSVAPLRLTPVERTGVLADAAVLDEAREADVDLIVVGTRGGREGRQVGLGGLAVQVVHFAPCPVLVVPQRPADVEMPMIDRILVPIDFSPAAAEAFAHARELAVTYGATLDLLHVFDTSRVDELFAAAGLVRELPGEQVRRHALATLERWGATPGDPQVPFRVHLLQGKPATRIAELARDLDVGLVVISSHGAGSLGEGLLGTTAERVLRLTRCPIFVLRSDGRSLIGGRGDAGGDGMVGEAG